MPQTHRQVSAILKNERLAEFDALADRLGLTPSAVVRLAVRRLAQVELPNQTASLPGKEAA